MNVSPVVHVKGRVKYHKMKVLPVVHTRVGQMTICVWASGNSIFQARKMYDIR